MLNTISAILQAAAASPEKRTIAVAAAHDRDVLEAVAEARRAGIAQAVLTGHGEKIREILRDLGEDPADYALVEADSDAQCAALAVAEVREGALGYETMNAACVCGAEVVNPKVPSMLDAKALTEMTDRWAPYGMQVCGPVGLDLAVSEAACHHKHFSAPGAGQADILLVPTYEVGNGIGKAMSLFGGAKNAGIILGAKVPIVLVSRADSAESKLASIALGAVTAGKV